MDQLKEMGEFVRSASSVVEHPVAQKLREQFFRRRIASLVHQASGRDPSATATLAGTGGNRAKPAIPPTTDLPRQRPPEPRP